MTTTDISTLDEAKLEAFVGQAVVDMGAAISGLLLHIGDRLGLYKAMAGAGPVTSAALAQRTGTAERYVREWLANQAAGGYVVYDLTGSTYELPPEQAMVVANEDSPVFLAGAFETIASCYADHDMFVDAFRTGAGVGWHAHDQRLFSGVVRLFRPSYAAHLVNEWLPALDAVVDKLRAGANVADVGCGYGASTIIMAQAFEHSTFAGFDIHEPSIQSARAAAADVHTRATFDVATAKDLPGHGYDLVCLFDALHDLGDPVGVARRIRQALAPDGTLLLVEPSAGDALEQNLNPVGRAYYGLSTVICTPGSLAQEVGVGLGAQAGERQLATLLREAGLATCAGQPKPSSTSFSRQSHRRRAQLSAASSSHAPIPSHSQEMCMNAESTMTETAVRNHLQAFLEQQGAAAIVSDYDEDASLITEAEIYRGTQEIHDFFSGFIASLPAKAIERFTLRSLRVDRNIAYISWCVGSDIPLGTDTFVVNNGKIVSQTFAMYAPSAR